MADVIIQQFLNWSVNASILCLLAVGYSMLFGVLNVLHFSHGDVCFIAPFVAVVLLSAITGNAVGSASGPLLILGLGVAVIVASLLGALIYLWIIRPFEKRDELIVLVATVSLGVAIRQSIRHLVPGGEAAHAFPSLLHEPIFTVAGTAVNWFEATCVGLAIVLVLAAYMALNHTAVGLRIRALAQDREVAQLFGIRVLPLAFLTFFAVSVIGSIGAILFAANVGAIRFDYSVMAGILGFSAAVIGGLGSLYGAIIGAVVLAGAETLVQALVTGGGAYTQVVAFSIVIVFLIFKPAGILGKQVMEKV